MVALKDADAGDMVPCAVFGVVKMVADQTASVVTGEVVMNSAAGGVIDQAVTNESTMEIFGGSSYAFGVALQSSSAANDEILVLLGKTF